MEIFGNGKSYLGDTIEIMDTLISEKQKFNFILTSPPYNMRGHSKEYYNNAQSFNDDMSNEDYKKWILSIFNRYEKLIDKDGVIFFNMNYMSSKKNKAYNLFDIIVSIEKETSFTLIEQICWKKDNAQPLNEARLSRLFENVFVFIKDSDWESFRLKHRKDVMGKSNYIQAPNNDYVNELNKACFSSSLVEQLLKIYSVQNSDIVLDNFMGTHTTAIGCEKIGCKWVGIELDKETRLYGLDRVRGFIGDFEHIEKYGGNNLFTIEEK
jgi:DNA modification methylase